MVWGETPPRQVTLVTSYGHAKFLIATSMQSDNREAPARTTAKGIPATQGGLILSEGRRNEKAGEHAKALNSSKKRN